MNCRVWKFETASILLLYGHHPAVMMKVNLHDISLLSKISIKTTICRRQVNNNCLRSLT